ncbi:unnamed protein product [Acanthoscelides obtectus]|uniref:Tc1-like transposase DDE domain-containing protein n=1 Tax=Acanthoscelides obtectus TaxID=200917 RepID=A0A9P0KNK6_ACAOB|nr:unnamed protein product [Acanthoscelides obtectus]CAK1675552.1 hypothetical protein AOBTE_LOCUS30295 [Acanthoscelides obtectus]
MVSEEQVTIQTLWSRLRDRALFDGSATSLRRLLRDLGFKWLKDNPRRGLMELPSTALKRVEFLRQYNQAKVEALYQFVFLDETWIFQNGTIGRSWQNGNQKSVKAIKTDGKRYIILHAGNENGFIEGSEAIFSSKTKLSDYHGEMNQDNFLKWFQQQLLEKLESPSMIILDNAPYHSMILNKVPNNAWTKKNIQDWLTNQDIPFLNTMFKTELLSIVARNKPPKIYVIDELAEQHGHKVLRLPPYHCIFNPIELIWGIAKGYYNRHIGRDGNSEKDCLDMWNEALQTVTPDMWKNSVRHTEQEIFKWYERERIFDPPDIEPLIINFESDEDSDSDSAEERNSD